jgi:hypothetical protein
LGARPSSRIGLNIGRYGRAIRARDELARHRSDGRTLALCPWPGRAKQRIGEKLGSRAAYGEGTQNVLCAILAGAVPVDLAANTLFGLEVASFLGSALYRLRAGNAVSAVDRLFENVPDYAGEFGMLRLIPFLVFVNIHYSSPKPGFSSDF